MLSEEATTTGARSTNEPAGLSNLDHQEAVWHQQQLEESRPPMEHDYQEETLESLEAARYDLRTGIREEETALGRQRERERRLDGTVEPLEAALTRELNRHQQRTTQKK